MRPDGPFVRLLLLVMSVLVSAAPALAQQVTTDILEDDGRTVVLEFRVEWPQTLSAAVDSAGITEWRLAELEVFSGGLLSASTTLDLPVLEAPSVRVVSREFDELRVLEPDDSARPDETPVAGLAGLGYYRTQPVVDVVAAIVRLDRVSGMLERVRRVRLEVVLPDAAGKGFVAARSASAAIVDSRLSDGRLFRLPVTTDGIMKVDRAVLTGLGLNPDTIDPAQVRILGNGGRPLPALNSAPRPIDVMDQAAVRVGAGDGRFDASDMVLFSVDGPRGWIWGEQGFEHYVHPFSNENAYFLKIADGPGTLLETVPFPDAAGAAVHEAVSGRYVLDVEEQNWSREHGSGQEWMSNTLRSGTSRQFLTNHVLPGLMAGSVDFRARVAIASNPRATIAFESDGVTLVQRTAERSITSGSENPSAAPMEVVFSRQMAAAEPLNLTMRLLQQTNEPEAALDWVRITYDRELRAEGGQLRFHTPPGAVGAQEFVLGGFAAEPIVLDITDGVATRALQPVQAGATWRVQLTAADIADGPRELIAFQPSAAQVASSTSFAEVPNQNLRGTTGLPDFIIVAPVEFLEPANRLADRRRSEGLDVKVATVTGIYNEFSGGVPDMRATRDYFKFVYDRAPGDAERLRYVLLFGDGHFDFRSLSGFQGALLNHVFPYETEETLNTDASFTSDDYFGLLDDNEGIWAYSSFSSTSFERVDIGVGRLPVQTVSEANLMVDKIESYESSATRGPWRATYTVVADDGPTGLSGQQNDADLHMANVDQVAELIRGGLYPDVNIDKIYAESFERVFLNGFRIPDARRAIVAALNDGSLVFNYSGHGGPDGLAQEQIFTTQDAQALSNGDRLSVFVTATCSFGWWDLEDFQSGAEELLLNPNGGAVALMTTVRLVYTSGSNTSLNAGLNRALNIEMFTRDADGLPRRLGDVMRHTKNTNVGLQGNSRKFNLLGDPTLRLGIPADQAQVTSLNGVDLGSTQGQMKALDKVRIAGDIRDHAGGVRIGFNGPVSLTVFDAVRNVPILQQRIMPTPYYIAREDLIWRGTVQAVAGQWEAEFVVPKDISYSNEPGRISVYAYDDSGHALGYSESFLVGGTSDSPPDDSNGPEIRLYMNDSTFVDGSTVPADPTVLVRLYDESGINTVGAGVGHETLLVVDADESGAIDISDAFEADENSFQRGEIRWPLTDLEPGNHTVRVRAWDVINNSNTEEISFVIATDEVLDVRNVYNYPNPMNRETRFVFEHNQPSGTPARVDIRIYTLNGQPIRTIPSEEALPEGVLGSGPVQVLWDGRDDDLDRPATGVYLYRVRVETQRPGGERHVSEHIEKLAIIR